jgi:hypothetical protein
LSTADAFPAFFATSREIVNDNYLVAFIVFISFLSFEKHVALQNMDISTIKGTVAPD